MECQCPLPWGSDWRPEAKNFYCKSCHRSFDDRWWEFHTRDVIEPEVPDADDDDDDDGNDHAEGADGAGDPAVAKTAAGPVSSKWLISGSSKYHILHIIIYVDQLR